MNVTIGADPEVFLRNTDGVIVSAIGHVGGSKYEPQVVQCGAVQEDNVLAEFNIDPANSREQFVKHIHTVMAQLRERVSPFHLDVRTSHEFTKHELVRSGRAALMFGCDPDFCAYTGEKNEPPTPMQGLRTAGGHVHVGYPNPTEEENAALGKALDLYLGVPGVLLDSDNRRRSMYGKAGAIRHKPYGMEYRTLSNFWLRHTDLMEWVYDNTLVAYACDKKHFEDAEHSIQMCINNSDAVMAESLVREYNIRLP